MTLYPGSQIDEFQIIRQIGRGGFGDVYLANDKANHRKVAIKQYRPVSSISAEGIQRFLQEARIIENLHDPNIVGFYGLRHWNNSYCLIMEFVEGGSLRDQINRGKKFSLEEVVYIGQGITQALMKVHGLGVIHRDIKPENILLTLQGLAKVSDFGLSYMAPETGGALFDENSQPGTIPYMSPEQITGGPISRLTDAYAVGVVLYELLAGKPWINIAELEVRAKSLASTGTFKYGYILQALITEAIVTPKNLSFAGIRDDVPDWLRDLISHAIHQHFTVGGTYQRLTNRANVFGKDQFTTTTEEEVIKSLKLAIRPLFRVPPEYQSLIIATPWDVVNNLYVYVVLDTRDRLDYLDDARLRKYSISREKAFQVALQNLEFETQQLAPQILYNEQRKAFVAYYETGGELDASRILLPLARQALCQALRADSCIAAIPDSNLFIACIPDRRYVDSFISHIREQYVTRPHPVSDMLFRIDINGNINAI